MMSTKVKSNKYNDKKVFDEIVKHNFKSTNQKSVSRITIEVVAQLTAFWALTNLAIYVWRLCTGC